MSAALNLNNHSQQIQHWGFGASATQGNINTGMVMRKALRDDAYKYSLY